MTLDDLQPSFLSLKVGEKLDCLRIKEIQKITNKMADDNLAGVDFKYFIRTKDHKVLNVNAWVLWKDISAAIVKAGRMQCDLEINHVGPSEYTVKVL